MIYVMLGAPIGALLRMLLSKRNDDFPKGTLIANLTGSFLLGICAHLTGAASLYFSIGVLGSFTTFSTLNLELVQLYEQSKRKCFTYMTLTYIPGPILFAVAYHLLSSLQVCNFFEKVMEIYINSFIIIM
ncbi:fluoride efflux transporter FluC [Macrococcus armenti]|uniref:Fluoride-specific ion channel FluC n=1 Tax=Macrococcus armenti TaxID=2875764 RepID=A0ABY3ZT74_9STAP|nr:CrcB family protein [Macrococcus armenti]UOB20023.1 CrcB family protein [Macrococcus armenti]